MSSSTNQPVNEKPASLIDKKSRGGIIALDGFDFQRNYALILLIESLSGAQFRAMLVEGAEDVEVDFGERTAIQVKNTRVEADLAREVIGRFQKLDADSPGTWRTFEIVCTGLDDTLNAIHNALDRYRNINQGDFYDPTIPIVVTTRQDLLDKIERARLPAEFVLERVTFRPNLNVYQMDDWVRSQGIDLLRRRYLEVDEVGLERIYSRLKELVTEFTGRVITRQHVEDIIQDLVKVHTRVTAPANRLGTLHSIPLPPDDFTGREAELGNLLKSQQRGRHMALIWGIDGSGKTTLAYALAARLRGEYPEAQLLVDLQGTSQQPIRSEQAMAQVIRAWNLDIPIPDDPHDIQSLYRSVLDGKHVLLLLDNARDVRQVAPFLPPPAGCYVLITAIEKITYPSLEDQELSGLPEEKALDLLKSIDKRLGEAGDASARLAAYCDYLPLAMRLSAQALADRPSQPVDEFMKKLENEKLRLKLTGMRSSLQVSYNLLKPSLQRKLCRLAAFPASFDRPAAAAVWKVSAEAAQMVLDALLRSSWLVFDPQTGRFHLHTQVRSFLDEQLSDATRKQAFTRHARYYLDVVTAANQRFAQRGENMLQGLRQLDAEWPNIQAGQAWAARQADQDENAAGLCARYPDAASQILPMRLSSTEWIAWLEPALKAAQRANQPELAGSHLGNLGNACMALERYDEAIPHYKSALDIARPAKNRRGEASSLNGLGRAYQMLAQYDEAVKCYQRALEIEQSIHDQRGEGVTLGNLGNVHQALKQYDQAKKDYEQALAIAKDTGDRLGEARRLENLAGVYRKQGDLTGARHLRQQALAIYEDLSGLPESEAGAGN